MSHGEADPDLAFSTGEALRDVLAAAGASVEWVPFEQGHEIPLLVWRRLRKFLQARIAGSG
jgi:phospholipase/carboxylesterase